ncbi:unnamed protein product [Ostreobium quekettii]|uniref:ATP-dependent DNA helicase RecG n=1 Tax=Ostreobium quekettii TaxID=121088 RepID=A0A8S1J8A0_9CHLO|nr:unnamed protein product [Ostreobium quekettii]
MIAHTLFVVGAGWQAALMAPIETLAQQHFKNLCDLISNMPAPLRPKAALLTGSTKTAAKRDLLRRLATGDLQILVGTHALLSEGVDFQKLGLAVIDEQQKFGVRQRERLQRGDISSPHILMTTATPIPRTLALALHGTMVISCIKSMPPGRLPVQTTVVNDEDPQAVAQWQAETNKELDAGGRAFIVYPLIEESTSEGMESVKAAEEEYERMKESRIFGNRQIVLMHGRMSSEEKSERMRAFVDGIAPVMVSTTVIEVGMDVREASIMVVNNADRFGLAQLHQLRGRVGRGSRQSKCFLVSNGGEKALGRLKVLEISNDGHKIAEADLRIRGAGELLGSKQSGFMGMYTLTAADLITEGPLMDEARTAAAQILAASGGQIPQGLQKIMEVQGLLLSEDSELC